MNGIAIKSSIVPLLVRRIGWVIKTPAPANSLCPQRANARKR